MNALGLNWRTITRAKRVRERARARSASFPPIVRAYRVRECWRVEVDYRQKNNLSQNTQLARRKG